MKRFILFALLLIACHYAARSQNKNTDTAHARMHAHRIDKSMIDAAGWYSMMLPGAGQIYNKQYWKAPIALAGVALPIKLHIDYRKYHSYADQAVTIINQIITTGNESLAESLHPDFKKKFDELKGEAGGYDKFRRAAFDTRQNYRRYRSYTILWALLFWAANVADATAAGHLRSFDVGENISMNISPAFYSAPNIAGVKLVISRNN